MRARVQWHCSLWEIRDKKRKDREIPPYRKWIRRDFLPLRKAEPTAEFLIIKILNQVDKRRGNKNRDQRKNNSFHGNVRQRQSQYYQVSKEICSRQPPVRHFGDRKRQCVIAPAGATLPHNQTYPYSNKQSSENGGK